VSWSSYEEFKADIEGDEDEDYARKSKAEQVAQELGIETPGWELDKHAADDEQRAIEEEWRERQELAKAERARIRAAAEERLAQKEREDAIEREVKKLEQERAL
jgi:hypothetical protein